MATEWRVKSPFEATESISGRKRQIVPEEVVTADLFQLGPVITIEVDMTFFLVDSSTFRSCCDPIQEGSWGRSIRMD
jgi:hypothetical protein